MGEGVTQVLVELLDDVERDLLGAGRRAGAHVGSAAEALVCVLGPPGHAAGGTRGRTLRQAATVSDMGSEDKPARSGGAGDTAAADGARCLALTTSSRPRTASLPPPAHLATIDYL